MLLHIPAAILYSVLGAFQFAPGFRRRHRKLHRVFGALLIPAALVVATTGLWMTHFYPWPAGHGLIVYVERLIAGTQVLTHLPWFLLVDRTPGELPRGVMMGAAWLLNIGVAEYVIRRGRTRQAVTRATTFRTKGATMATVGNATGQVVRQLRSQAEGNAALQP